jgi:Flp pilus assembly protein TadG
MHEMRYKYSLLIRSLREDLGGAMVETALTLPILVLMLLGAGEFGRVAYTAIEVSSAARAGVSYGAQSTTTVVDSAGIQKVATDDAPDLTLTTTVGKAGTCADGVHSCSGTNNSTAPGSGPVCQNTDCTTSQVETILTVTTSASVNPMITVPGLRGPYTVTGRAVQKVLKN